MKKSKLRALIREEAKKLVNEGHRADGEMAIDKLEETKKFARMLCDLIDERDNLPEWVMEKIIVAANDFNDIYQYMEPDL